VEEGNGEGNSGVHGGRERHERSVGRGGKGEGTKRGRVDPGVR